MLRKLTLHACLVLNLGCVLGAPILADGDQTNEAMHDSAGRDSASASGKEKATLSRAKDLSSIIESIFKTLAIIVGGIWTYNKFIRERAGSAKANVDHNLAARAIPEADVYLVNVSVAITNIGNTLIPMRFLRSRIRRVLPLEGKIKSAIERGESFPEDRKTILWPELDRRTWSWGEGEAEIEPGEVQVKHCEFIVPATTKTVQVYTFFKNSLKADRHIGWTQRNIVDLSAQDPAVRSISGEASLLTSTVGDSQGTKTRTDSQEPEDPEESSGKKGQPDPRQPKIPFPQEPEDP